MNQSRHRIVLIGDQGVGKTTLFNLLTGSSQKVAFGGDPLTQQLFLKGSKYGEGFDLLDTPGFGVSENKFQHSACLVAALIEGPVSRVCIVVSCKNGRTDIILRDVKNLLGYCSDFLHLVTVVVTQMDQYKEKRNEGEQQIAEKLKKNRQINYVIFTSFEDDPQAICNRFDSVLKLNSKQQLNFPYYEIHHKFDVIDLSWDQENKIQQQKIKIEKKFSKTAKLYLAFIERQKKELGMVDVMHNLILSITEKAQNLIQQFQNEYGHELNNQFDCNGFNLQYLHDIILKKEIWVSLSEVIDSAQIKMKEFGGHCYNFLRKCPHCGEVWLKVEGCYGLVTCGNFPSKRTDKFINQEQSPVKISFVETADSLEILNKYEIDWWYQKLTKNLKFCNNNPNIPIPQQIRGCKKDFIWRDASPLDEETIKELLNPELAYFFTQRDPNVVEIKPQQKLESEFNQTFELQVQKSMKEMIKE